MSQIQGYKLQSVSSMDFNHNNRFFVAGGKQTVKIIEIDTDRQYWFELKKTIGRNKGASITKTCASELAWNKNGVELIALGTTNGYVVIYDVANNNAKNQFQIKGHDGNIKNIVWLPKSTCQLLSSSYENQIIHWDIRTANKLVKKFEYQQSVKIRDIKFNPHQSNMLAVQCSSKLEIFDLRNLNQPFVCKQITDNEVQGNVVQWDPFKSNRLASSISKQIQIMLLQGGELIQQDKLNHYFLIKYFRWLLRRSSIFFGISGQHPQRNICFYDMEDKNRVHSMYAGNSRSVQCWMMDEQEKIIISASNPREKTNDNKFNTGFIIAQKIQNYIDPNEQHFNHPIAFNNDNNIAFTLHANDPIFRTKKNQNNNNNTYKYTHTFPLIYQHIEPKRIQNEIHITNIKHEIQYLHTNYMINGKNQQISIHNYQIAKSIGKNICAELWKNLFIIVFPQQNQQHTLESIFQEKIKLNLKFIDNRIIVNNKSQLKKQIYKYNIQIILQYIVDENQLQTAVLATICILRKNSQLINDKFFATILNPYIQILRSLDLYVIASQTILLTNLQAFMKVTTKQTQYAITCGWCRQSTTKNNCKCNVLCVLCQEKLNDRIAIWCKYCGHGGHAIEYKKWFQQDNNKYCPHGCGHMCFEPQDFL